MFTRVDLLSEFDVVWKRSLGFRVSAAGWWDPATTAPGQQVDRHGEQPRQNGMPVAGPRCRTPSATPRARPASSSTCSRSPSSTSARRRSTSSSARPPCTGAKACCSAAPSTASPTRRTRSTSGRALATPGAEAKELFRPRVGFNVQSQVTDTLSVAAQYFFNWQRFEQPGLPLPGVRHLPERRRPAAVGRRVVHPRPESVRGACRAPRTTCAPGAARTSCPTRTRATTAVALRWSPTWADAHVRRLLPPHLRHAAAADADARPGYDGAGGDLHGDRRPAPRARTNVHHQQAGDQPGATCAARAGSASTTRPSARTSTSSA